MATVEQCEGALAGLAGRLAKVDHAIRKRHALDRSLSCRIPDLGVVFVGSLLDGELQDLRQTTRSDAQVQLTVSSDDLVALVEGRLGVATAVLTGRLKIDASMTDLLRIRSLL